MTRTILILGIIILSILTMIIIQQQSVRKNTISHCGDFQVIDGDTIIKNRVHYRLKWIDTPEIGQGGSEEAKQYTCNFLKLKNIELKGSEIDIYGRTLVEVNNGKSILNNRLIYNCLAKPYYPNTLKTLEEVYKLICK